MNNDQPEARVEEINGQVVLIDPQAVAIVQAISQTHCRKTMDAQIDRVRHFLIRMDMRRLTAKDAMIVLINVNEPVGGVLADVLMPGCDWQAVRDRGEIPFARGIAMRKGMEDMLSDISPETLVKYRAMKSVGVLVVDHGAVCIFEVGTPARI